MYAGVKEQSGQFVRETSENLYSYLQTDTTVLARNNKTLEDIALHLFDRNIPFKLAKNLLSEFESYCDEEHEQYEAEPNSLWQWFSDTRKKFPDEEIIAKFKRLTSQK